MSSRALLSQLDWPLLRQWEETAKTCGFKWECYAGRAPRKTLLALLPEFTALFADVPLGALQIGPVQCEIEGYDRWYETLDRVGGAHHLVVLRAPDGSIVGLTEAMWDSRTPALIYEHFTAVARPWRGRGLAKALKAPNRRLQSSRYLHDCSDCFRLEQVRRVGLAPTGKRRLVTAHANSVATGV